MVCRRARWSALRSPSRARPCFPSAPRSHRLRDPPPSRVGDLTSGAPTPGPRPGELSRRPTPRRFTFCDHIFAQGGAPSPRGDVIRRAPARPPFVGALPAVSADVAHRPVIAPGAGPLFRPALVIAPDPARRHRLSSVIPPGSGRARCPLPVIFWSPGDSLRPPIATFAGRIGGALRVAELPALQGQSPRPLPVTRATTLPRSNRRAPITRRAGSAATRAAPITSGSLRTRPARTTTAPSGAMRGSLDAGLRRRDRLEAREGARHVHRSPARGPPGGAPPVCRLRLGLLQHPSCVAFSKRALLAGDRGPRRRLDRAGADHRRAPHPHTQRYTPATSDGKPVKVAHTLRFRFALR